MSEDMDRTETRRENPADSEEVDAAGASGLQSSNHFSGDPKQPTESRNQDTFSEGEGSMRRSRRVTSRNVQATRIGQALKTFYNKICMTPRVCPNATLGGDDQDYTRLDDLVEEQKEFLDRFILEELLECTSQGQGFQSGD